MEITLDGGKYKVVHDEETGSFKAYRYGELWRDLTGDKLVLAMFAELVLLTKGIEE